MTRRRLVALAVGVLACSAFWLALVAGSGSVQVLQAQSSSNAGRRPLRVVIKPLMPFVIVEGDPVRGFSIDLWQEIVARRNWTYEYQVVETVAQQMEAVAQGWADVGITGISITQQREEVLDFSMPYFKAGLQIMTRAGGSTGWVTPLQIMGALVESPQFLRVIGNLALVVLAVGHIFWFVERKRNPDFPTGYVRGVWEGIWYTVVTLVTVFGIPGSAPHPQDKPVMVYYSG